MAQDTKPTTKEKSTSQDLKHLERNATVQTTRSEMTLKSEETYQVKTTSDGQVRMTERVKKRSKSAGVFLCIMLVAAVGALLFASPTLVLVNNKEQLTNDLNDGYFAYRSIAEKVLGAQLGGGSCSTESISCKFHTMSPMLKQRFERYKFTFDTADELQTGRYSVNGLKFPDGTAARDGDALVKVRSDDYQKDVLADKVFSLRNGLYQNRGFFVRLLERFGLQQGNTIKGNTREAYLKSFDERIEDGDKRYTNRYDDDPDAAADAAAADEAEDQDYIDANGRGIYGLHTLADSGNYWLADIYSNTMNKANTHMALACGFATYGNMMETALARAKTVTMARFAMNYVAAADDVKSFSMHSNMDLAVDTLANSLLQPNDAGLNAMDAPTYEIPALGVSDADATEARNMIGLQQMFGVMRPGAPSALGTEYVQRAVNVVQSSSGSDLASRCAAGMSGAQQGAEQSGLCYTPASMPLAGFIGAATSAVIAPAQEMIELICAGSVLPVVKMMIEPGRADSASMVTRMATQARREAAQFTSDTTGLEAQHAIFAGTAAILGDRAQSLGMRPASQSSYQSYMQLASEQRQQDERTLRRIAQSTPWDASNPYSFSGTVVAKLFPASRDYNFDSWFEGVRGVFRSFSAAAQSVAPAAQAIYTQPVHFSSDRLSHALECGLPASVMSDISLDMGCNVRYSMSRAELDMDIDDVITYMTQARADEVQESLSQTQSRDTGADGSRGGRMKSQASEGANAAFVNPETGAPNKYTEYAKFIEFCTNRYDPWGQTSMYVEQQDERYVEDQEINGTRTSQGRTSNMLVDTRDDATAESYYAAGWGSSVDQDWFTGKKCTEESDMLNNFRVYTMACAALADMSGSRQCWHDDTIPTSHNNFYTSNNIIFEASDF